MFTRNLGIALLISLSVHILWMSVVTIIPPEDLNKKHVYTRVDFLGPILRKAAFDIMLKKMDSTGGNLFEDSFFGSQDEKLNVAASRQEIDPYVSRKDVSGEMDRMFMDFLGGDKTVPDIVLKRGNINIVQGGWRSPALSPDTRDVLYKPETPLLMSRRYGDEKKYKIKANVMIGPDGIVKMVDLMTTTGHAELDIVFITYIKGWIFEQSGLYKTEDEWREVEVLLYPEG